MTDLPEDLTLSKAGEADSADVYALANDPEVRRNSFNPRPIAPAEHQAWFSKQAASPECVFLIVSLNGAFAGYVRFNKNAGNGEWVCSVAFAPNLRGKGMGGEILRRAALAARETVREPFYAYVKFENPASIKAFQKAGYALCPEGQTPEAIKMVFR